jgi:EAL and modified HD-GYP domain-containing signal transduction protein
MTAAVQVQARSASEPPSNIYLARQPIFDSNLEVVAYEILFRNSETNAAFIADGNKATSTLITNTFVEMGLDEITDSKQAFINLTRDFLTGRLPLPFRPGKVVLEILEDISADEESICGTRKLADEGYTLALDDFVLGEHNAPLIPFASYIKVDIRPFDKEALTEQVRKLKPFSVKLLAEKVETREEYALCKALGFEMFQGYFFSKPTMISGKQVPASYMAVLEILAKLQAPNCTLKELEDVISYDVGISYKLLRIINSSYYNLNKKVESIQHALVIIGLKTLKSWITVISLSAVEDKPRELITMALVRAKMCENLATQFHCKPDAAFIVGLFSLLDILLDQKLETLVANLPLAGDIVAALLRKEGSSGRLLSFVIDYEQGDWANCCSNHTLHHNDAVSSYLEALQWTREISRQLM